MDIEYRDIFNKKIESFFNENKLNDFHNEFNNVEEKYYNRGYNFIYNYFSLNDASLDFDQFCQSISYVGISTTTQRRG